MFLRLAFNYLSSLQKTVLVVNTVLLIAALIVVELVYAERPKRDRQQLLYFVPLLLVMVGLLIYAAYKQVGAS